MILFSSFTHIWVLLLFLYLGLASGLVFFSFTFLLQKFRDFLLKPKQKKKENKQEASIKYIAEEKNQKDVIENIAKTEYIGCEDGKDNLELKILDNGSLINNKTKTSLDNSIENKKTKIKKFKDRNVFYNIIFKKSKSSKQKNKKKSCFFKKLFRRKQQNKENKNKQKYTLKKQFFLKIKKACMQVFKPLLAFFIKIRKIIINVSFTFFKVLVFLLVIVLSYIANLYLNFGFIRVGFVIVFCLAFFMSKSLINLLANFFINFYNYFIVKINKTNKFKKSEKSE